jgi:hypothetical protein
MANRYLKEGDLILRTAGAREVCVNIGIVYKIDHKEGKALVYWQKKSNRYIEFRRKHSISILYSSKKYEIIHAR